MKTIHGGDVYSHYETKYAEKVTDFSTNLNPLGMPDEIKNALCANVGSYEPYPDIRYRSLKQTISLREKVPAEYVFPSNGAAEAIYRIVAARKPKKALICAPAFAEYALALRLYGCEIKEYVLKEENAFRLQTDFTDFISDDTDVVFICNPNNPTGACVEKSLSREIIKKASLCNALTVFDECFLDFTENESSLSVKDMLAEYKNLVVIKAFTKMYAMAGVRLGYSLCSSSAFNASIEECGPPWNVSSVAEVCAEASLQSDKRGFCEATRAYVKKERDKLCAFLRECGMKVFEPQANYIFFKCGDISLYEKLVPYGILIRKCSNYSSLNGHFYRIAVRMEEENAYFMSCLKKLYGEKKL